MKQRDIFISHIELASCFLDVNSVQMAKEHLSEASKIAAKIKNVLCDDDSEKIASLKNRLENRVEQWIL